MNSFSIYLPDLGMTYLNSFLFLQLIIIENIYRTRFIWKWVDER